MIGNPPSCETMRTAGSSLGRSARCNASFGELLQGVLRTGEPFLVNFKIRDFSSARFALLSGQLDERPLRAGEKARRIVELLLAEHGIRSAFQLYVATGVPIGKGLSSSTADMIAALRAAASTLQVSLTFERISQLLTEIEPNDGLHYPGTTVYLHTLGHALRTVDYVPRYRIVGIDCGGVVDTVEFNRARVPWAPEAGDMYEALLAELVDGLARQNLRRIAAVATQSTCLWQDRYPKSILPRVLRWQQETDALGIVNAHSGTYVGLLYPPTGGNWGRLVRRTREEFRGFVVRSFHSGWQLQES